MGPLQRHMAPMPLSSNINIAPVAQPSAIQTATQQDNRVFCAVCGNHKSLHESLGRTVLFGKSKCTLKHCGACNRLLGEHQDCARMQGIAFSEASRLMGSNCALLKQLVLELTAQLFQCSTKQPGSCLLHLTCWSVCGDAEKSIHVN